MIITDPLPLSSAPLDGTPVRLFVFAGSVIASFWSEERSREAFGPGDYREGWYLIDDDAIELDDPMGWEPLAHDRACFENETVTLTPEPVPL
jgi:hypothetical protein